jgi:hypothetical protein
MLPEKDRIYINSSKYKNKNFITVSDLTISILTASLLILFYKS